MSGERNAHRSVHQAIQQNTKQYKQDMTKQGPKMKFGSCCWERRMQLSCPTLRSLANFVIELKQPVNEITCLEMKYNVTGKIVFPHLKCYGPQNCCVLQNSMSSNFCCSKGIFGDVCAELQSLHSGVLCQKNSWNISSWTANWICWIVLLRGS